MSQSVHLNYSSQLADVLTRLPNESGRLAVQTQGGGDASSANQDTMISSLATIEGCIDTSQLQCDVVSSIPISKSHGSITFPSNTFADLGVTASIDTDGYKYLAFCLNVTTGMSNMLTLQFSDDDLTWSSAEDFYSNQTHDSAGVAQYTCRAVIEHPAARYVRFGNFVNVSAILTDSKGLLYTLYD